MPRAKSKSGGATAKKQPGRPKGTAKAAKKTAKTGAKAGKATATSAVDGRIIPASKQTVRAEGAAERAAALLRDARQALAESQDAAAAARAKAKQSGGAGDKTAVKKVRLRVARAVKKVAALRDALRDAKLRVAELKADDRYKAKANTIAVRLREAEEAANERIEAKLDRAVKNFRNSKLVELTKAEAKKARARKRQAEKSLAGLAEEKAEKIRTAKTELEPKPRKKRRRRTSA